MKQRNPSPQKRNPATRSAAPLPVDWPYKFAMFIKDEAIRYANAIRGPFPDPEVLRERAVERVIEAISTYPDTIDAASETWIDRWDSGELEPEIANAIDYYGSKTLTALEENPSSTVPWQKQAACRLARGE